MKQEIGVELSEKRKKSKLEPVSMILKERQGGKDPEKLTEKKQRGQKKAKKMKCY